MHNHMLKAKLHRVRVTHAELHYEGSCAIDSVLLDASGIREYEQIHIYNVTNGERFVTYAIRAEANSGVISINGAAAHKGSPGDIIIIAAYAMYDQKDMASYQPTLVYVDERNRIVRTSNKIPVQAA